MNEELLKYFIDHDLRDYLLEVNRDKFSRLCSTYPDYDIADNLIQNDGIQGMLRMRLQGLGLVRDVQERFLELEELTGYRL